MHLTPPCSPTAFDGHWALPCPDDGFPDSPDDPMATNVDLQQRAQQVAHRAMGSLAPMALPVRFDRALGSSETGRVSALEDPPAKWVSSAAIVSVLDGLWARRTAPRVRDQMMAPDAGGVPSSAPSDAVAVPDARPAPAKSSGERVELPQLDLAVIMADDDDDHFGAVEAPPPPLEYAAGAIAPAMTELLCNGNGILRVAPQFVQILQQAGPVVLHSALVPAMRALRGIPHRAVLEEAIANTLIKPWMRRTIGGARSFSQMFSVWLARIGVLEGWFRHPPSPNALTAYAEFVRQLRSVHQDALRVVSSLLGGRMAFGQLEEHGTRIEQNWNRLAPYLGLLPSKSAFRMDWLLESAETLQTLIIGGTASCLLHGGVDWRAVHDSLSSSSEEHERQLNAWAIELDPEAAAWLSSREPSALLRLTRLVQHPLVILKRAGIDVEELEDCDDEIALIALRHPWALWSLSRQWPAMGPALPSLTGHQLFGLIDHAWRIPHVLRGHPIDILDLAPTLRPRFLHRISRQTGEPTDLSTPDTALKRAHRQGWQTPPNAD